MKAKSKIRIVLWSVLLLVFAGRAAASPESPQAAAMGVIKRLLPEHADSFVLELISADGSHDAFEIESVGDKIHLRGANGVAICSALNWYLKYYC